MSSITDFRNTGSFNLSGNLQVQYAGPLDPRLVVKTKAGLTEEVTFKPIPGGAAFVYAGMVVTVVQDPIEANNGLYFLKSAEYTDPQNWVHVSVDPQTLVHNRLHAMTNEEDHVMDGGHLIGRITTGSGAPQQLDAQVVLQFLDVDTRSLSEAIMDIIDDEAQKGDSNSLFSSQHIAQLLDSINNTIDTLATTQSLEDHTGRLDIHRELNDIFNTEKTLPTYPNPHHPYYPRNPYYPVSPFTPGLDDNRITITY